jgi:hypothetical protein
VTPLCLAASVYFASPNMGFSLVYYGFVGVLFEPIQGESSNHQYHTYQSPTLINALFQIMVFKLASSSI